MKQDDISIIEAGSKALPIIGTSFATVGEKASVLVIACGALAREILAVKEQLGLDHLTLTCLPANLHNRPEDIPQAVRDAIHKHRANYGKILIGFGDCGTGGLLDRVLQEEGVERLEGAHCYAFFSGSKAFETRADEEFTSFYLTDFLVRNFETMVIRPLGLDRFPQLRDTYFQHYEKLVYIVQHAEDGMIDKAKKAAERLQLPLEIRQTGYGDLEAFLARA
ncbi:DUF1638 domain-containing protein [Cohaesibacter gelatinilyticus]|uniref:DUF1638 domain-containing protein n=1 Tax=Cohaesibacter gelatinilyticus TaxID=372072 RepID=A0A285PF68_9HYPH|nr:DUF1638 domain-containing protein [Cohaesibacter gelatinilyticus]SNZ20380.1 Protein of unknown function [Cohaesibacter gelatinilyticus]HAT84828.1 DUF1638 domain-containing protein [Hyphomicrobiales bacterium]